LSSINSGGAEGNLVLYAKTLIKISAPWFTQKQLY
jgi:hypothetical protein